MTKLRAVVGLVLLPGGLVAQTLRGSQASVDLMYMTAHAKDLAFFQTPGDVYAAVKAGELELISITNDLMLEGVKYPFVLPNTRRFADSLAAKYHTGCGERLVVTSGVRPVDGQPRNASPESVHPTGMAVDFRRPTGACLKWIRSNLLMLEDAHVIEATEEHHPPHFHVAVLHQLPEPRRAVVASAASALSTATQKVASSGDVARAASHAAGAGAGAGTANAASESDYRVRAGDNLWAIAQRHGTTAKALQALNGFRTTRLRVGQQIKLP